MKIVLTEEELKELVSRFLKESFDYKYSFVVESIKFRVNQNGNVEAVTEV